MKRTARSPFVMTIALAAMIAAHACTTSPDAPAAVPTFHDVAAGPDGVRTGYRVDEEGADWQFHSHRDELDEQWCGDLAIAPGGVMRYLAFLHPTPAGTWMLSVRTGVGPSTWSTTFSTVEVPPALDPDGTSSIACHPVRIAHLEESLYGIVWISNGELHNAVYNADGSPPSDLALGPVLPFDGLEGITARQTSLVRWNGDVQLVWSPTDNARIETMSGELSPGGITFGPYSSFTSIPHEDLSAVISRDGAMHVAARHDGRIALYTTTIGGTGWHESASCETPWNIRGTLLFADASGDFWVAETSPGSHFDNHLRNFTDCSTRPFPLPNVAGKLSYQPGAQ